MEKHGRLVAPVNKYLDSRGRAIEAGMSIRCALDGEVEKVIERGGELGIAGNNFGGDVSFFPLSLFGHRRMPGGELLLCYFEVAVPVGADSTSARKA